MSRRLQWLSLRFVLAAALLGCLVSALPFRGQVHAATQPQLTGVIPSDDTQPESCGVIPPSGPLSLGNGVFTGQPDTKICIGPNGVITVSGAAVHVIPNHGYVLARFNPGTGQWQAVPNNTVPPGTGAIYALIPGQSETIPSSGQLTLANGTVAATPGTDITVESSGVITVSGATAPVRVTPKSGYVLARFDPATGQWEEVPNNTIPPGTRTTYGLISANRVPHLTSSGVQLGRVIGGRTAACKPPRNAKGAVPTGCQVLNVTAPVRSHLSVTVSYAGTRKTQHFVVTADAHGRYHGAFPVAYNPPARNKRGVTVTVTVVDTLPNGAYGGKKTIKFVAMPRPTRGKRPPKP